MATLARSAFKLLLFCGLFYLSLRYVHTYPWPMPGNQSVMWWRASRWLGIRDPEDSYFWVWVPIALLVATLAYVVIMKLWRYYRTKS